MIEGAWEENIGFTAPPGPEDYFGAIRASLTRWRRTSRNEIRFTVDGTGYAYREDRARDRADGGASLQFNSHLSRRVQAGVRGSFAYAHTDSQRWLVDDAVLLPLVRTLSGDAGGDLAWQLDQRTSLSVGAGWARINFDSDVLLDTETWSAATSLARQINQRQELSLRLRGSRIEDELSVRYDAAASLDYSYRFARNFALDLSAGVVGSDTVAGVAVTPQRRDAQLGAGLTARLRGGHLSVGYWHGLQPIPGLGVTELTDGLSVSAVIPVVRRLEILARGSFALRGEGGNGTPNRRRDMDAFAGGAVRLARRLRLVLGYRFRYRDYALEGGSITNNRASVSVAWGPESLAAAR